MSLVRAGVCAAGDGLHGHWAELPLKLCSWPRRSLTLLSPSARLGWTGALQVLAEEEALVA